MIKTYRGQLADGGQDKIRLKTIKGEVGYRIAKFDIFPSRPGAADVESTLMIWKVKQSSVSTTAVTVDFTDGDLLAVAYMAEGSGADQGPLATQVIFDQEIFNQDIYVTHTATSGSEPVNYYLELEEIKLNENQTTMATLQSLRQIAEK